ncbi:MAG: PQQ-binding-like beta-propeller repeat protein [Pirellulales bacterium]
MTGCGDWRLGELRGVARVAAVIFFLQFTGQARGGDWPQLLGPDRNGHAAGDERLADAWPDDGPKVLWQHQVGRGFAAISVVAGSVATGSVNAAENATAKAVLFHRDGNEQIVEAFDAASGKPLWRRAVATRYVSTISDDDGPRATPVVHAGRVYCLGADGELLCVALDSGKQLWIRHLSQDFEIPDSYFGAGSTPLVEGENLLVNVGGRGRAGIVAFRLGDGKTAWQATDEVASYSAPVAATIGGVRHAIFVTRYNVVSLDPANGKVRFSFPFGKRGPTVNAAAPLVCDGNLFVTASYGIGAVMSKIESDRAAEIWRGVDGMASQYTTCVYNDGVLYGCDGRADQPPAHLRALDAKTGRVLWSEEDFGVAHLIFADGKLLALKDDGTLVLFAPSKEKFRALASAKVLDGVPRAVPALSNGRLYVRDADTLKCLDVGK